MNDSSSITDMATTTEFVTYVKEQSELGDQLSDKKMFGEYALYIDAKVVALVCDNSLFIKPSAASESLKDDLTLSPPYPGAKPYILADALLDEPQRLRQFLLATAAALPTPKAKPKTKTKRAKKTKSRN